MPIIGSGLKKLGGLGSGAIKPVNTVLPVISGTVLTGQTLSTTDGTWTGTPTITYTYQWKRNGSSIGGATNSTYQLTSTDSGATITVTVTATNAGGSTAATSAGVNTLATSLVSYWKLDESSNGSGAVTRNDSHGTNHLTDNNTVASGTGKISNAAAFVYANNEALTIADASQTGLDPLASDFSVSFWLYVNSFAEFIETAVAKRTGGGTGWSISFRDNGASTIVVHDGTNTVGSGVYQSAGLATGAWYWIDVEFDRDGNAEIFVNNVSKGTLAIGTVGSIDSTAAFSIGRQATNSQRIDASIDETGFWSRLKTSEERAALYNGGSGFTYPFLT